MLVVVGLGLLAYGLLGYGLPLAEAGHINCGDVLKGTHELDANIGPCATAPALTLDGGKLEMQGFTVSCADDALADGIVMTGAVAKLKGPGTVAGCIIGVDVQGRASTVERITVENNATGISIVGDANLEINNNLAFQNRDGFMILGRDNKLTENIADSNRGDGFQTFGDDNTLSRNLASRNGDNGFTIALFSSGNTYRQNTAIANTANGFEIVGGRKNELQVNNATFNGSHGFLLLGFATDNKLTDNIASHNGDGYSILGKDNKASGNLAVFNAGAGLGVAGQDNTIKKTTAVDNGIVDLLDHNLNCDNNTWRRNFGGSRIDVGNPPPSRCIK
jgi:parallel beta-helix repeat protein